MNLASLLTECARRRPDAPALALGPGVLADYRALALKAARLAGALRGSGPGELGCRPGDRVALVMTNNPDYPALLFACWQAGLAAVPMNARLQAGELAFMLAHSGARVCFVSPDLTATLQAALAGLERPPAVIESGSAALRRLERSEPLAETQTAPDDLAWLFYTSGTTGRPKGAMLSHRNLRAMLRSYFLDVDPGARAAGESGRSILHAAPLSHGSGLYVLPQVAAGACQVIPESGHFDPAEFLTLLPAHPGVSAFLAPTMVKRLVEHPDAGATDLGNLRTLVYGGGPMYVEDLKRGLARLGPIFVQIYGQGESPMTITALDRAHHLETTHPEHEARLASVGRAQSVVELRVADGEDRPLPPGELGEVLVRGDSVMTGYWQDPEASAETLRGGWLHTGDLGVLDEAGYLTLKDRSKDLIISGGSNIYPRELEELLQSHPGVLECAVVGRPDPEWGETVVAFIVARPGLAEAERPTAAALDALCLAAIARFKRPRDYRFLDALPKNNYGKVLKRSLRESLRDES